MPIKVDVGLGEIVAAYQCGLIDRAEARELLGVKTEQPKPSVNPQDSTIPVTRRNK